MFEVDTSEGREMVEMSGEVLERSSLLGSKKGLAARSGLGGRCGGFPVGEDICLMCGLETDLEKVGRDCG
jgi:hypothetical protein